MGHPAFTNQFTIKWILFFPTTVYRRIDGESVVKTANILEARRVWSGNAVESLARDVAVTTYLANMKRNLRSQTDDELVEAYRDAAAVHGVGTVQGDRKLSNAAAKLIERIYKELGSRGARQKLLSLLDSDDAGVQSWVGAHALEIAPERGVQVLESLARQTGLIAFSAAMTLKTWRDGALRFP